MPMVMRAPERLMLRTASALQMVDITDRVADLLRDRGFGNVLVDLGEPA